MRGARTDEGVVQLSRQQENAFVKLYKEYGRAWGWGDYASKLSDEAGLYGADRITGPEIREYIQSNRKRLHNAGLTFPNLPKRIDKERFAELYEEHGKKWTWAQYAAKLSEEQGFSGKDAFTAASISAHVSRNRDELRVRPRHVSTRGFGPWPSINLKAYKQQHYWRFLQRHLRAQMYGEDSLKATDQYKRYVSTRNRLWRDNEVIRYDPDRGFYAAPAHKDELDPPQIMELEHHYYARHPEQLHQRDAKDT